MDDNKEIESSSSPLLYHENMPGEPMFEYFKEKLPPELNRKQYEDGLGCLGTARLVVNELGGVENARIYWQGDMDIEGHAFVVPSDASPDDLALNNSKSVHSKWNNLTNQEVIDQGKDITEEVLEESWERL